MRNHWKHDKTQSIGPRAMSVIFQTDLMKQTATYWPPGTPDGSGAYSFSSPSSISCRWENKQDRFTDAQGRQLISAAIVYPDQLLQNQGWLYLGTSTESDPHDVSGAYEIKAFSSIPDMSGQYIQYKAWL